MTSKEALQIVDCVMASKGVTSLSEIERQIFCGAWENKKYEEIAVESGRSCKYISQDVAPKLWKHLTEVFNEQVGKKNLRAVVARHQNIQQALSRLQLEEKTSPDFIGREAAIEVLNNFMSKGHKIISIYQRGGEGKTTLAKQFLRLKFGEEIIEFFIPKEAKAVSSFEILLEELLQELGSEPGLEVSASLGLLRQKLKIKKVGILIDNLETLLDGNGKFLEPHRSYLDLLRILSDSGVQSITLITSRCQLCEPSLDIENYFLEALDISVWQKYFSSQGINFEDDSSALEAMYKTHGGNALAMKLHCGRVLKDFRGNTEVYWRNIEGEQLLKGEVRNDDSRLRNLVIEQFDHLERVDTTAYNLLMRMGCYRYQDDVPKIPKKGLTCLLWDVLNEEQGQVITSLKERALIEFSYNKETGVIEYYLHPEIKAEAVSRLRRTEDWEIAHRKAARFWHQEIQQIEDGENALKALEAYYHCIRIEAYEEAAEELLFRRINSIESANRFENGATLGGSLIKHSLFSQIEFAATQLIAKVSSEKYLCKLHSFLGCIYRDRGEIYRAVEHFDQSQKLAVQAKEKLDKENQILCLDEIISSKLVLDELVADSLLNIANCKAKLGEFDKALDICEQVKNKLECAEEDYFLKRKIHAYFSLAYVYSFEAPRRNEVLSYARKAYEENLTASLDKHILGLRLVLLGTTYKNIGDFEKATSFYSTAIDQVRCPTVVKAEALYGLAEIHRKKQDFELSKKFCKDAIKLLEEIGAKFGLAEAYLQLSLTLKAQELREEAEESIEKAIETCRNIGATKQILRIEKIRSGHVSSGALVFRNRENIVEVLLLYRRLTDSWHLPKGTYELGLDANLRETAVREVYEETGFEVELLDYLGSLPSQYYLYGEKIEKETHYFLGRPIRATGVPDNEHDEQDWVERNEAKARLKLSYVQVDPTSEDEAQIIERFETLQRERGFLS